MQFLTWDELTPKMEPSRVATSLQAFSGSIGRPQAELWRKQGSTANYVGIFAVESGEVIGHVMVQRLPYTYPDGKVGVISGIAMVATRPDHSGRGIARKILEEVHRREREAGIEHAALWTNRSWGAHGIYDRLGYRDAYSMSIALREPPNPIRRPYRSVHVRPGKDSDFPHMEVVHREATRGRIGFTPRLPRGFATERRTHDLDPAKGMLVATRGRKFTGYARVEEIRTHVRCPELLAVDGPTANALMDAIERRAARKTAVWVLGSVRDLAPRLRRTGYLTIPVGWYTMMGLNLRSGASASKVRKELGVDDPRWTVHRSDQF